MRTNEQIEETLDQWFEHVMVPWRLQALYRVGIALVGGLICLAIAGLDPIAELPTGVTISLVFTPGNR